MAKGKKLIFLASLIILSLSTLSCRPNFDISSQSSLRNGLESSQIESDRRENKLMIVFFDITDSTLLYRAEYLEDFDQVFLPQLDYKDRIIVSQIREDSIQEAKIIVDQELPRFTPNLERYSLVEKDNFLVQKALEEEIKRQKDDFVKKNDLNAIRKDILDKIGNDVLSGRARSTDIFSALKSIERLFSTNKFQEKVLIIFSDMIEDSKAFDFEREEFTPQRIKDIIDSENSRAGLPDLSGVKVYVVGARATKGGINQFYKIKEFWAEYFKMTGAQLVDYGRRAIR